MGAKFLNNGKSFSIKEAERMFWKLKLICPKCGGKAKPRKYFEKEQAECLDPEGCGHVGEIGEFKIKK